MRQKEDFFSSQMKTQQESPQGHSLIKWVLHINPRNVTNILSDQHSKVFLYRVVVHPFDVISLLAASVPGYSAAWVTMIRSPHKLGMRGRDTAVLIQTVHEGLYWSAKLCTRNLFTDLCNAFVRTSPPWKKRFCVDRGFFLLDELFWII